jgi:hypothetical protein
MATLYHYLFQPHQTNHHFTVAPPMGTTQKNGKKGGR